MKQITVYTTTTCPYCKMLKEYLEQLKGWVASCITAIADELATIQIRLYQHTPKGIEEIEEHDVLNLLYKVNSAITSHLS